MANFYDNYEIPYDYNNQVNFYGHDPYHQQQQQQQFGFDPMSYNHYHQHQHQQQQQQFGFDSMSYNHCHQQQQQQQFGFDQQQQQQFGYDPMSYNYYNWNGSESESQTTSATVAYSVSTMSEPKHLFYDPNLYLTYESAPQFSIYRSVQTVQEFNEPEFDEYDPTPYGGGFDIAATYGKPLPPSVATCYPSSTSAQSKPPTPPEIIAPVPLGIYDGGEKKLVKKRVTFAEPLEEVKPLETVKEAEEEKEEEDESEEEEEEDEDEEVEEEEEDHSSSYGNGNTENVDKGEVKALYVPSGYGLEATDLCEVIFGGYFPCVLRNKRREEDEKTRAETAVSWWESNDSDPWKKTSDYLFGDSYPYGYENRTERNQFEISSYGYRSY